MKAAKLFQVVAVTLILVSAGVGCKKRMQGVTPLPGSRPGMTGADAPRGPMTDNAGLTANDTGLKATDIPSTGLAPIDPKDMLTWPQNRDAFRDQTVLFDYDKSNVRANEVIKLETVASQMKSTYQGKALLIEGYADERGTEEYNRSLGERRALSVRESLVRLGLDPSTIATISYGEDKPVDPAHNEAAWSKNRRCEIILLTPPSGAGQ